MSPSAADRNSTTRVAVVGAPTPEGARLRDALVAFGVPGKRVDLYGGRPGDVLLSEYGGEARMIQAPDLGEIAGHDVIFICEEGEVSWQIASRASEAVVIDLLDCLPAEVERPRVHMDINPQAARQRESGCFTVPHPLALLLAELLHPLERELGLAEVMAVVLRPASDFGEEGLEELREQTVRLLSFSEVPVETFGSQLAFNIIPQARLSARERDLEARITGELAELLSWDENRATVRLLTAPLFHGHGLQLRFRLQKESPLAEVRSVLGGCGLFDAPAREVPATPLEVIGEIRVSLSDLSEDGLGGIWLWAVAGETASRGAQQAVRLASHVRGL